MGVHLQMVLAGSLWKGHISHSPGKQLQSRYLCLSLLTQSGWLPAFAFGISLEGIKHSPFASQSPNTTYPAHQMVCGGGQGGATARRKLSPKEFLQKSLSTQPLNEFFTFSYIAEGRWWANADRTDSISFSLPVPCKSSGSFF